MDTNFVKHYKRFLETKQFLLRNSPLSLSLSLPPPPNFTLNENIHMSLSPFEKELHQKITKHLLTL